MSAALGSVDVVVVGSGAGGSPMALQLARAGAKVVVLEKGRAPLTEEFVHDEIKMVRRNYFVPYPADEPHVLRYGEDDPGVHTNELWTANVVGGGTVHMSGYFFRAHPIDMRLRTALGPVEGSTLADWPISYQDLAPYYDQVEEEIGVSGRWKSHPFEEPRTRDYLLPPLDEHPFAERIDRVSKSLGVHPFPTPRGIISRPYQGRSACNYCSLCGSFGCEMDAKSSTRVSLLPKAVATGHCEVRPQSMATEVTVNSNGKATGVVYRDAQGNSQFQPARCVVVACTAVESARLLLSSQSSRFPKGLGNNNGLVGKNLILSGFGHGSALFRFKGRDDRQWVNNSSPFVQRAMQDFYWLDKPIDGVQKAGTVLFSLSHPSPINQVGRIAGETISKAIWGAALKRKISDEAGAKRLDFETFAEYLPTPLSYVDLDPKVKDKWGLPSARITLGRHPLDYKATGLLVSEGMKVLRALEPDEAEPLGSQGETKILQGGTCRFGDDPQTSVLNSDCRSHEVSNLYVSDGSFVPTGGSYPITLTILANSFRVGHHLAERFKKGLI